MLFDPDSALTEVQWALKSLTLGFLQGSPLACVSKKFWAHLKFMMWLGCLQLGFHLFFPCLVRMKFTAQFLRTWKTVSPPWDLTLVAEGGRWLCLNLSVVCDPFQKSETNKMSSQITFPKETSIKGCSCLFASCSSRHKAENVALFLASKEHHRACQGLLTSKK